MKVTAILLFIFSLHVSATSLAQRVTLSGQNVPFEKIIDNIKNQTGYSFFYNREWLQQSKTINIHVKDIPLEDALKICFANQPFSYAIVSKTIVLKLKPVPSAVRPSNPISFFTPVQVIRGYVNDTAGNPLEGATITVIHTDIVQHTNAKGEFELDNVNLGDTVIASFIGYQNYKMVITDKSKYLYFSLKASENELDQTIVQAYGTTTRRFSVGAISTITTKDIEQQPVTNVLLALEGRVPGLLINQTNGAAGSAVLVQVRGQNTLRSSTAGTLAPYDQPLFIVDGVPYAPQNQNLNQLPSISGNPDDNVYGGISPFNSLNPADIESISILKDADATSIYGTQGANGVVLITTKKGQAGRTKLDIRVNTGPNKITRQISMMSTQEYLQMRHEAFAADGITPNISSAPDLVAFDTTRYTNWFQRFFGETSNNTDVHASLSGGTQNTTFIFSGGYTHSTFNFPGGYADNRMTMHSAFHHNSLDHRLTIDFGTDFSYDKNNAVSANATNAITAMPDLPSLTNNDGSLVWNYKGVDLTYYNLYAPLKTLYNLQAYTLNSTLNLNYKILNALTVGVTSGYSRVNTDEYSADPLASLPPQEAYFSDANFYHSNFQTITVEPQINYEQKIGSGHFSALVGGSYKKNITVSNNVSGYEYNNDALLGSIGGAQSGYAQDNKLDYKYVAMFGRLGYIYDQKYIINLTGRRDGSSNFGPGRQFGNFGSAAIGWIFSEEKGFKKVIPFVSYAKLYGSYGTSGSDGVAPYQYQDFWQPVTGNTFQGARPYLPMDLYNPDYSWDTKKAWNLALDLGFLKDRILFNATWYRNRTGNQLTNYTLPSQAGFTSVVENLNATVQDIGWEFTLASKNIVSKNFSWTSNFNLTFNRNKLIAFPNLANSSYAYFYQIGKSTSTVFGYKYKGVNDSTGLFQFYNIQGNPTYTPANELPSKGGDLQPIADLQPKYFGGLGNTFTYKGLSLTVFFQFSKQTGRNYLYALYSAGYLGAEMNLPKLVMGQYWTQPGDHALLQRLGTGYGSLPVYQEALDFVQSSGAYADASYVRLKTLSISYNLPEKWLRHIHMKQCNVYINAQNLLTFSGYKVGDPETPGQLLYTIPIQRIISCGLSFDF